jgi:hypothetical protein
MERLVVRLLVADGPLAEGRSAGALPLPILDDPVDKLGDTFPVDRGREPPQQGRGAKTIRSASPKSAALLASPRRRASHCLPSSRATLHGDPV